MKVFNPDKELYKIQNGNKNRAILFIVLLLVVSVISYSFALYQVRYSKRIIYTKVAPFSNKDIELAVKVLGENGNRDYFPDKTEGLVYKGIDCEKENVTIGKWDDNRWGLNLYTTGPNKCTVTFVSGQYLVKYLTNLNYANLITDETSDNNLRYIGNAPNNYIWFNCKSYDDLTNLNAEDEIHACEKWRVIGLMKNIHTVDGNTENLVKIVRANPIGSIMWDSDNINNWEVASLQKSLNGDYIDPDSGVYTDSSSVRAISKTTQHLIENVIWNTGGVTGYNTINVPQFYAFERGVSVPSGNNSIWKGKIALIYPSDYGYASSGGNTYNRSSCLNTVLYIWHTTGYKESCADNDWLLPSIGTEWTLTPNTGLEHACFGIGTSGQVDSNNYGPGNAYWHNYVSPSLYLKSDVIIKKDIGDGSEYNPYVLIP